MVTGLRLAQPAPAGRRRVAGIVVVGRLPGVLVAGRGARVLQPIDQHLQAGGEPLVAVVDPDVLAEGDQGGKAFAGQRAEELVQLGPGGGVADALLVD